jgi:hypothetical protein
MEKRAHAVFAHHRAPTRVGREGYVVPGECYQYERCTSQGRESPVDAGDGAAQGQGRASAPGAVWQAGHRFCVSPHQDARTCPPLGCPGPARRKGGAGPLRGARERHAALPEQRPSRRQARGGRARRARRARRGAAPRPRAPHQERASGPHAGFPGAELHRERTRRPHGLAMQGE